MAFRNKSHKVPEVSKMKIRKALCPDRSGKNHFLYLKAASSRLLVLYARHCVG
jgi:hypothetical protein